MFPERVSGRCTEDQPGLRIRKMTAEDVQAASVLEAKNFPGDPWTKEMFLLAVRDMSTVCLCAEVDGAFAALVIIRTVAGEGNIDNVSVDPVYRRRGIARTLLKEAMRRARAACGAESFTLEVRVSNREACALYASLGFVNEGIRPGYYFNPREDAYIYWMRNQT